ncbi:MAG TPA: hypothetical protein VFP58_13140 [Candidatus Eisenbacteria bacterium]|nr:hypothetical protein [Candidatus Eisenbacteria bacterium]
MTTLDLVTEPRGQAYAGMLELASEACASFSLVWRDQLSFHASAQAIAADLAPFLVRQERTAEWPGTQLLGHLATVRHYRLEPESLRVLKTAEGLYAWHAPELPEDLALYTPDGMAWLTSIAHERDAWFLDAPELETLLRERLPRIHVVRSRRRG